MNNRSITGSQASQLTSSPNTVQASQPVTPSRSSRSNKPKSSKKATKKVPNRVVVASRVSKGTPKSKRTPKKKARAVTPALSSSSNEITSSSDSSETIVIEETPPPSTKDLQREIQKLKKRLRKTKSKHSRSRRGHRHGYESDSSSKDSEEGDIPRVSFLHQEAPLLPIPMSAPSALPRREPPPSWYNETALPRETARLLWWGLTPKTRSNYLTSLKSYSYYCIGNGFNPPFPATLESLYAWITWLTNRVKTDTIFSYLKGLKSAHVDLGYESINIFHNPQLKRILTGARRLRGDVTSDDRQPVTSIFGGQFISHRRNASRRCYPGATPRKCQGEKTSGLRKRRRLRCDVGITPSIGVRA